MAEIQKTTAIKSTNFAKEARKFVKGMYSRAHEAKAEGRPVAWVMVNVYSPILRAMDVTALYTENYAGLCSAKMAEGPFIQKAEADGYSNQICGYARSGLGYCGVRKDGMGNESMPDGGMADPDMLLGCSHLCDTRYKWYEAIGHYYNVPIFNHDVYWWTNPYSDEKAVREHTIKYQVDQYHRFIAFLEKHTGKKMDWDRLREAIKLQNDTHKLWYEIFELRKAVPCPMPSQDSFSCMVPYLFRSPEPESLEFYKNLRDEVKERVAKGIGAIPNEKYRLLFAGIPNWHHMNIFNYFESKGAVFAMDYTYYPDKPPEEFPVASDDPLEVAMRRMWASSWKTLQGTKDIAGGSKYAKYAYDIVRDYRIDGIVYQANKSCRALTIGQMYEVDVLNKAMKVPTLVLESDMADSRDYSEAQSQMRIDAFLETVDAYKQSRGY